jgi:hypothetical protein
MQNGETLTDDMSLTMIRIDTKTRERLKDLGKKGESYDLIIVRLLDAYNENHTVGVRHWNHSKQE